MYPLYFLSYIHNGLFCQSENEDAVRRKLEMDTEEVAKQGILYSLGQQTVLVALCQWQGCHSPCYNAMDDKDDP